MEAEQGRSHHAGVVDGGPVVEQLLYDVSVALPARPDERGRAILQENRGRQLQVDIWFYKLLSQSITKRIFKQIGVGL